MSRFSHRARLPDPAAAWLHRPLPAAVRLLIAAAILGVFAVAPVQAQDARPPNILLILVDDLGKEWISCYGAEGIETPHIDRLARGGTRFERAYSMPQCTPTRVTLFTGQYPFRHGWCNHWDVPRWGAGCHFDWKHNPSFARLLRDAGYATAIAGKWQINDFRVQPDALRRHGFDDWCVWTGYETGNPPSGRRYWDPYVFERDISSRTRQNAFGPDVFTDFLIDFMKEHRDEPMLLYYPMVLTHGPLVTTPSEPDASTGRDKLAAMVRYTDELVGRLMAAIEELELEEETIVIFTTDNGTSRGMRGSIDGHTVAGGKARLTENGTCQPFIVYGPGRVPADRVSTALLDFTDLLPTFADLAQVEVPADWTIDGRSQAAVFLGHETDGPRDWILSMGFGPAVLDTGGVRPRQSYTDRALRDERYKVIVVDGTVTQLFDLWEDPWEERNLLGSDDPEHVAALRRLRNVLATFPDRDAAPRYEPTPAQPWDKKRG